MRTISITIVGYLFFFWQFPLYALPGDSVEVAIQRFNRNQLSSNALFSPWKLGDTIVHYVSNISYKNNVLNVDIRIPERNGHAFEDIVESFNIENSSIGSKLKQSDYNLRKDDILLNIIEGLWGDQITQDFSKSRFTNRYINTFRGQSFSTLYKGEKFGYSARYYSTYSASARKEFSFNFVVSSLRDWKIFQLSLDTE
ncbi:MAG TPA: hypothetical protein V6D19_04880 [Stenomitos sp.]